MPFAPPRRRRVRDRCVVRRPTCGARGRGGAWIRPEATAGLASASHAPVRPDLDLRPAPTRERRTKFINFIRKCTALPYPLSPTLGLADEGAGGTLAGGLPRQRGLGPRWRGASPARALSLTLSGERGTLAGGEGRGRCGDLSPPAVPSMNTHAPRLPRPTHHTFITHAIKHQHSPTVLNQRTNDKPPSRRATSSTRSRRAGTHEPTNSRTTHATRTCACTQKTVHAQMRFRGPSAFHPVTRGHACETHAHAHNMHAAML